MKTPAERSTGEFADSKVIQKKYSNFSLTTASTLKCLSSDPDPRIHRQIEAPLRPFSLEQEFTLNDKRYFIRKGEKQDIHEATRIYNLAYAVWKDAGFVLKEKTKAEVAVFLTLEGYVVTNINNEVVACASVRPVIPKIQDNIISITRAAKTDLGNLMLPFEVPPGDCLYFYGLCIDPRLVNQGMGAKLIEMGLTRAKQLGFSNCFLETGLETWLVDWYKKLGFRLIAQNELPVEKLHTIIMHCGI